MFPPCFGFSCCYVCFWPVLCIRFFVGGPSKGYEVSILKIDHHDCRCFDCRLHLIVFRRDVLVRCKVELFFPLHMYFPLHTHTFRGPVDS